MAKSLQRRIVKRAVLAVAAVLLLLASYVSSYGVSRYLIGQAAPSSPYRVPLERWGPLIFEPVYVYQWTGMPGGRTLRAFGAWCFYQGRGQTKSWSEIRAAAANDQVLPD